MARSKSRNIADLVQGRGNLTLNSNNISAHFTDIDFLGTGSITLPAGTTAQRDASPTTGAMRFNTTLGRFEGYWDGAWAEIGGGSSDTWTTDNFTGDGSTAAYTLTIAPSSEDNVIAFIEGVFQNPGDYVLNGTTITFDENVPNGQKVIVHSVKATVAGNNLNQDLFAGDGSTTDFTLSIAPINENNTMVYIDGVYQNKSTYSTSGTTLAFSTAPPNSTAIEALCFTQTNINTPTSNSVGTASLIDDSVTGAKLAHGLTLQGNTTVNGTLATTDLTTHNVSIPDNYALRLGSSQDLQLYHDGAHSYVSDVGTGGLKITGGDIYIKNPSDADMIHATSGGAVNLFHNAVKKFETTSTGVTANGIVTATTFTGDLNGTINTATTATTQANSVSSTTVATTEFVSNKLTNLIGGAPGTLDTLNELAAAINDDSNYNSTLTTALATKLPLAGGTMTGNIAHASDFTIDAGGDIILNADGGDWLFNDGAVTLGSIQNDGNNNIVFMSNTSDQDIKFLGIDGGNTITALALDMSNAGRAVFNAGASFADHVYLADDDKLVLGNADDLQIFHDGNHSMIQDLVGTGALKIKSNDTRMEDADGNNIIKATSTAAELYFSGSKKLETNSGGVAVTGTAILGGASFVDNATAYFGTGNDLRLYHDGGNSYIKNLTGWLNIPMSQNGATFANADFSKIVAKFMINGSCELYEDGAKRIETTTSGIDVTGVGSNFKSTSYNILNLQTDTDDNGSSDDGIFKITNGSAGTTKAEFRWDESEDLVHVSYGDHGRHVSINSSGKVGIGTGSTSPTETLDVAGTALVENTKLKAIAASNSDTAVDVFVYDTRKDSDGGAWRKRTQHTSWYNETLNTSTRGARKEFPSVAVLAFNTSQELFIYDGDDPDLPIWAKYTYFTQDAGGFASITAINGSIYGAQASTTSNYSGNGYFQLNFAADYFFSNIISVFSAWLQGRADGLLTSYDFRVRGDRTTPLYGLRGYQITDLDTTVLPNAPIAADTGLPIPTIAVGTEAGVGIIKDNGTVVDIINTQDGSAFNYIDNLFFRKDGALVWAGDSSTNTAAERFLQVLHNLPNADTNQGTVENSSVIDEQYGPSHKTGSKLRWATTAGVTATSDAGENFAVGTSGALHLINYNREVEQEGSIAHITSDYNTGYMLGDIKLATLSDTDTTNNPELITNGTFASGVTGWATSGGSIAWNGSGDQTATVTSNGSSIWNGATQTLTGLEVGKTYFLTADIITSNNWGSIGFSAGPGSANRYGSYTSWNGGSTFPIKAKAQFTAAATSVTVTIDSLNTSNATVTKVDNISVRIAAADRSYNNNGFQTFGTVTKTAVATGADLVAYSGFSSSNYLEQPYNSDFNFGTGDFSVMGWAYITNTGVSNPLFGHGNAGVNDGFLIGLDNGVLNIGILGMSSFLSALGTTPPHAKNTWVQVCYKRENATNYAYLNGKLEATWGGGLATANFTTLWTNPITTFGKRAGTAGAISGGSLALWRVSGTAPTDEQVAKMYNDEKQLFQPNAKATLYGTSDAVTALAYDDDAELLHAGTSAGRSVFQGINRVDNTTDAVGTAISASNGFIVEE